MTTDAEKTTGESTETTIKCPHCSGDFSVDVFSVIPEEQRTTMRIEFQSPFTSADAVGKAMITYANVLKEIAKASGVAVNVFVTQMVCESGFVEIEFTVAEKKPRA